MATGDVPWVPGSVWNSQTGTWQGPSDAAAAAAAAAASRAAAAEQKAKNDEAEAKAAGKSQTKKENSNTQKIINTLIGSVKGYKAGKDQSIANANEVFNFGLAGIDSQYGQTLADLGKNQDQNEADETSKTFANRANRARETQSILQQMQSQGAGETDVLQGMVQAFENADANQLDITTSYYDSLNAVQSGLRQANAATENARSNQWGQLQEAKAAANENYWNNYTQIWTDVQRTAASNSNVDSDYSTKFNPDYKGKDPLAEATRFAGKVYDWQAPKNGWAGKWDDKKTTIGHQTTTPTLAKAATRLGGLKRAEGASIRRKEDEL